MDQIEDISGIPSKETPDTYIAKTEKHNLQAITINNTLHNKYPGITVEEALQLALKKHPSSRAAIFGIPGLNITLLSDYLLQGEETGKRHLIQHRTGENTYEPERRMREIIPETMDIDGILNRLKDLSVGEVLELTTDIPQIVQKTLINYAQAGFLQITVSENNNFIIKKTKQGGIYTKLSNPAAERALIYAIRGVNEHRNMISNLSPEHRFYALNVGNVPSLGWQQPEFMVESFLNNIFPLDTEERAELSKELLSKFQDTWPQNPDEFLFLMEKERIIKQFNNKILEYPPTEGIAKFRAASSMLVNKEFETFGIQMKNLNMQSIPTLGAGEGIKLIREALAANGNRILHLLPGYPLQPEIELEFASMRDPEAQIIGSYMNIDKNSRVWRPDLQDIERQLEENPHIKVISIVDPGNPTGSVLSYPDKLRLFQLANRFGCVIESDETYKNLTRPGITHIPATVLSQFTKTPLIRYLSNSKDIFQCGIKGGEVQICNPNNDPRIDELGRLLFKLKEISVGAGAFPQFITPDIYLHPKFQEHIRGVNAELAKISDEFSREFTNIPGAYCIPSQGAMYGTVIFEKEALNNKQTLPIDNPTLRAAVEGKSQELSPENRFILYLMASTGIMVVPLKTGFYSKEEGFRVCNLLRDPARRELVFKLLAEKTKEYLGSSS